MQLHVENLPVSISVHRKVPKLYESKLKKREKDDPDSNDSPPAAFSFFFFFQ